MEGAQTGSEAVNDEWNDLALGHKTLMDGADAAAQELGVVRSTVIRVASGNAVFRLLENGRRDYPHEHSR